MSNDIPTMYRTFSDPDSLQLRSSTDTTYTEEKLVFPNPAISVISAVGRHAKRTCKQLASFRRQEKAPNMAKMRIVTPVYDHSLERWVWPDHVSVDDDEDEAQIEAERRRERRSVDRRSVDTSASRSTSLFAPSSRSSMSSRRSS